MDALSGEIINNIVSYLPIASVMALGLVNKALYDQVTRPRKITVHELMSDCLSSTTALANQPLPIEKSQIPSEGFPSISSILRASWSDQCALFDSEDRREKALTAPRVKYTEIIVWLEVMDTKKLSLVTCSICGTRQDPKCFKGTSGPQRSYTRTCETCLTRHTHIAVPLETADKALIETRNPTRLKRLTCAMCEVRRHTRDFPGWSPSRHMQLQQQEKRICWDCLRSPRNATQQMIGSLHRMGINRLKGFLDGELDNCYFGGKRGRALKELQKAKVEAAATQSRTVWELRDGQYCQRFERLARKWLAVQAVIESKTRSERQLARENHEKKMEEWRRGGLL